MNADMEAQMRAVKKNTLLEQLDIDITRIEDGYVEGTLPVDHRTHQPYGLLHGGATAALIETLGSFGSHTMIDSSKYGSVGIEINCNHLKSVRSGKVIGKASIVHKGRKLHVWKTDVVDENDRLIATGRLTVMIIDKP